MENSFKTERCYTVYRPGDLDISNDLDLQSELFGRRRAMEEGLRRILMSRGMVAETSEFETVAPVLAAQVLEVHGALRRGQLHLGAGLSAQTLTGFNGALTEPGTEFDAVVEVDMNHPEFYEFRKWMYAQAGLSCDRSIRTAIHLFDPFVAKKFAEFLGVNLGKTLFVVKPFDAFEADSHVVPFAARTAHLLGKNTERENPVNTVWLFGEQHQLRTRELPPRERAILDELRWRGLSK